MPHLTPNRRPTPPTPGWTTLALLAALATGATQVAANPAISAGGIHVPTVTNFCRGSSVVVEVTICNEGDETHTYDVEFFDGGTPPAYPCTESLVPEHTFLDPVPVVVGAGQCKTLHVRIERPDALETNASVCYWMLFTPETGGVVALGAQLVDTFFTCVDWYFDESILFMHPLDPFVLNPTVTNHSLEPIVFDYRIEVRDAEGSTEQGVIVLNDGGFAEPVEGSTDIGPGETAEIELTASWLGSEPSGIFDVVILADVPGPGRAPKVSVSAGAGSRVDDRRAVGEIASLGLARTTAVVTVDAPGPGSGSHARLRVSPNPWRAGDTVAFAFTSPQRWVRARVLDATGRVVRDLRPDDAAPAAAVVWDGRDALGRSAPPGVYFASIDTADGPRHAKVVRLP